MVDSRVTSDGVRRRRECPACKRRFTTYERVAAPNVKVVKRGGKAEPFSQDKLIGTLARVTRDRPSIGAKDVLRIATDIEAQLVDEGLRSVLSARVVEMALERLALVDRVAYERLAINYVGEDGQLRTRGHAPGTDDREQLGLFAEGDDD